MTRSDFIPKRRATPDCLAFDPDSWNAAPPAVEQAYRRGYVQGFLECARLAGQGEPPDALERFGYGALWRWRYVTLMRPKLPPFYRRPRKKGGRR